MNKTKYGRISIIGEPEIKGRCTRVLCRCDCGNNFKAILYDIKRGHTKSCGCYSRELSSKRLKTHGLSKSRLYRIWAGFKTRCYNYSESSYKNYGARGIIVCSEWKDSFITFRDWSLKNGYKDNLTIDRIDNDGNYEPENCRWVGYDIQAINRRETRSTSGYVGVHFCKIEKKYKSFITHNGKRFNLGTYKEKKDALIVRNKYILNNKLPHKIQEELF